MSKFTGNIIRLPAVTPTQNSASGVYTLDDQFTAQSSGTWPIVRDQYFNYTTLLLTGAVQGTAYPNPVTQPYSFLSDASTNNFVVSPNGDVSARPFNPYLNSYSNSFNGSTDYLSVADNEAFNFGSGNFTVEMWTYLTGTSTAAAYRITGQCSSAVFDADLSFSILKEDTTDKYLAYVRSGSTNYDVRSSITAIRNAWVHIALVRSGGNLNLYINGQLDGQNTTLSTSTINNSTKQLAIGRQGELTSGYFLGNIASYRIVKGTAVYTSNFTPPTQPLQNISGTSLLTCQANRFIDLGTANSGSGFTITPSGTPAVSQNSPFVSYDTTNGSGYFDGTGDYLSIADSTALDMEASDFTMECWVYLSETPSSADGIFAKRTDIGTFGGVLIFFNGLTPNFYATLNGSSWGIAFSSSISATLNAWTHLAFTRSGNTWTIYVNGVSGGTGNSSGTVPNNTSAFVVGAYSSDGNATYLFPAGYISNVRVVKGTAIAPPAGGPTAPLQAVTNTSLLTLQTRAPATNNGFIDSSPNNFVVTRNGNTTQGSFSPFSPTGWGNYFNGTSFISVADSTAIQLGSGDFTMEFWVYFPAGFTGAQWLLGKGDTATTAGTLASFYSSQFEFCSGSTTYALTTPTWASGRWYSVSIVRSGSGANNLKLYIDGGFQSQASIGSNTINTGGSNALKIGQYVGSAPQSYISNFRLIKGQGLYTGAYTPATGPLTTTSVGTTGTNVATSITGTVSLLTCQSNRFIDNSPNNFTITANNGPSVQAFSPFAPAQSYIPSQIGGSGYFDGGSDYLQFTDSSNALDLGGVQASLEFWIYLTNTSVQNILSKGGMNSGSAWSTTDGAEYVFAYNSGVFYFTINNAGGTLDLTGNISTNQWNHVAIATNTSNAISMYINGARTSGPITNAITKPTTRTTVRIGTFLLANWTYGYMSGIRHVSGSSAYDPTQTTITVPTAPPTAIPNTSLLLNFTNGGIVDATGKNNLETVANSGVQTTQAKWSPGSMYFDGGGDWLVVPKTGNWSIGSSEPFTIEAWVYLTAAQANYRAILSDYNSGTPGSSKYLFINSSGIEFQLGTTAGTIASCTQSFSQNQWYYIAITRNSSNVISMYVDGTSKTVSQATQSGGFLDVGSFFYVGRWGGATAYEWYGYIDDLRITKGIARTITASPTGPFPLG